MSWRNKIGTCFGMVDKKFALHPSDAKSAALLLNEASQEGVGFEEFCNELKNWMINQECTAEHINEQMIRIEDLSSYFQYD
ncbi:hypothetical protein [Vibrio algivorus]|uniref:Uncharacterized protein n=1 Tax=Vibrio algivorus TaxID=1667024 RepID=A0A557NU80_9VIBR|nr:hypothetical protein [Vibrio algivorus]TVO31887.1 hypothetical protein FOF44_17645 [Vibrio algivorus]